MALSLARGVGAQPGDRAVRVHRGRRRSRRVGAANRGQPGPPVARARRGHGADDPVLGGQRHDRVHRPGGNDRGRRGSVRRDPVHAAAGGRVPRRSAGQACTRRVRRADDLRAGGDPEHRALRRDQRAQPDRGDRDVAADRRPDRVLRAGRAPTGPDATAARRGQGRRARRQRDPRGVPVPGGRRPAVGAAGGHTGDRHNPPPRPAPGPVGARSRPDRTDRSRCRRDRRGRARHRRDCAHQRAAVLRPRPGGPPRCRAAASGRAAGRGAHHGAGPGVRVARAGRRRAPGAVARGQRPDDCRAGARRSRGAA